MMRSEGEILEQLKVSKDVYTDDGYLAGSSYVKGWIYALQWVLGDEK